jgi:hypothetical protein
MRGIAKNRRSGSEAVQKPLREIYKTEVYESGQCTNWPPIAKELSGYGRAWNIGE